MTQKPRRIFTDEQKAEAVRIVNQSGKLISQVAKKMGFTESALRNWIKQAQVNGQKDPQGALTTTERKELNELGSLLNCLPSSPFSICKIYGLWRRLRSEKRYSSSRNIIKQHNL